MFSELQEVRWHPDPAVDERLNTIVENHPDLSCLDTSGKRVAYVVKKSRSERFYHTLAGCQKTPRLRGLFVKMKNSRYKKQQRRLAWVQTRAALLMESNVSYITTTSSSAQDFCKIILDVYGTWVSGGRIWVWQGQEQSHPALFNAIYRESNYIYHIDTMIQTIMLGNLMPGLFPLLKILLSSYNLL